MTESKRFVHFQSFQKLGDRVKTKLNAKFSMKEIKSQQASLINISFLLCVWSWSVTTWIHELSKELLIDENASKKLRELKTECNDYHVVIWEQSLVKWICVCAHHHQQDTPSNNLYCDSLGVGVSISSSFWYMLCFVDIVYTQSLTRRDTCTQNFGHINTDALNVFTLPRASNNERKNVQANKRISMLARWPCINGKTLTFVQHMKRWNPSGIELKRRNRKMDS